MGHSFKYKMQQEITYCNGFCAFIYKIINIYILGNVYSDYEEITVETVESLQNK